ncbi:MAG TPA: response regulator [Thermoanaerobaculia bacterium]|nr:response regulator [Thermoanaerobaculia bacterium]
MSVEEKVSILLVDDQPGKLLSYQTILEGLGETLITAGSATEALEQLLRHDIAVVLVDVCMPDLDGFELAGIIREHPRYQKTSILFVSAVHLTELDRLRGYECGAVDYIPVPIVPEILRAKVAVFAELYRKTRQLERLNQELESRVRDRTAELEASTARLRESEEQLRDADRRKDEFLAMLAHELRNPLAPIRTAVQLMRFKELPDEQRTRARDIIERQIDQLVRLIDDLMDVSRITRGMITLHREPIDLTAVIARAVETTRPLIDSRRQELTVALPPRPLKVEGDSTRLAQVIGNVLNNAAKYTPEGGRIRLQLHAEVDEAVITVSDSGMGIPPEMLGNVFDLFTQVNRTLDRAHGGLGIGLALVRKIVQMHGGRVSASSAGLDQGTEIEIRLDLIEEERRTVAAHAAEAQAAELPELPVRRILVVDDNEDAAALIALLLKLAGQEVRTANDGAEALVTAAALRPDVVFLDLAMPGLNGYETARRIRQEPWGQEVALIALSGWGQRRDRARTAEAGFSAHLVKPVSEAQLLAVLAELAPPQVGQSGAMIG